MSATEKIEKYLQSIEPGHVFALAQLPLDKSDYRAAAKALSRLVQAGRLKRIKTGKYYKPEHSPFGEIGAGEEQLMTAYLFKDGKRVAYVTGPLLYNRLQFTTQLSRIVWIASKDKRIVAKIGNLQVKSVKSYVEVNDENIRLLEILDVIKDFKNIPDTNIEKFLIRLNELIQNLTRKERTELIALSLKYPPRVRALLGAVLENNVVEKSATEKLLKSLNPLSFYRLNISESELPNAKNWNIQ